MARRHDDNSNDDDDKPRRRYRLASNPSPWALEQRRMRERLTPEEREDLGSGNEDDNDNEDYETRPFTEDAARQILSVLKLIDQTRVRLSCHQIALNSLLRTYPAVQPFWRKFQLMGGVTVDDFTQFANGDFRPRITRQRKHLRLISSRKPIPIKLKKPSDAA
jgi:hypothetical protein